MRNMEYVVEYDNDMAKLTVACPVCGEPWSIEMPAETFIEGERLLREGCRVQNAFPTLNASEREFLITGTCDACWKKLFGGEE